ncbi:reverse transcriptase domain-containing protein [Tanacetum coccineum]
MGYFSLLNTPVDQHLRIMEFNLEGATSEWFQWMCRNGLITTWPEKEQNIKEKAYTTLTLPSEEASPVVKGPLDASEDTLLSLRSEDPNFKSQEKAVEYVRALNVAPLEVVFARPVDEVSSAIDGVFDMGNVESMEVRSMFGEFSNNKKSVEEVVGDGEALGAGEADDSGNAATDEGDDAVESRDISILNSLIGHGSPRSRQLGITPSNTIANPKGELKAITTRSGLVLDGPSVPMPPPFINPEEDERAEETLTDPELAEYTIKECTKKKQQEKDEVQIHKFWQMFKQLHINISLADALILIPKYQKMLKSLLSNKEKLLELANTPLNENCLAVILKKLPEKLGDPGKFLILCGFSELKCKALADLGASINLMPLSVWKKLGLPELISTRMTLKLANRAICTPAGIARDVFIPVEKFTFPADFVIVDYESDPRVPLILGRPFLRTARALIDVHGEEMILRDGDERLILNMRHDTSSYSNKPKKESINMIDIYNVSHKDYLEDLFANEKITNHQSGNPTFSSHTDLTSPEVINPLSGNPTPISEPVTKSSSSPTITSFEESDLIWEEFEAYLASDSFPPGNDDPVDLLLEEFADELALITFPPGNDDLPFDIEIEYLLNHDPTKEMDSILEDSVDEGNLADPNNDLVDTIPEMFTDEHTLDYSSPPLYDDVDDDLVELESDNDDVYDDPFDSKEDKIKESKLLIDELDPPRSSDFLPSPKCDSVLYEDFSEVDALPSTNNEDKVFNPGILIHENLFEVTIRVTPKKNVKKTTNASLILEDFNPPLYELPFHKEVPGSETLLLFSSENEEKVFNPGILTSKGVHTSLLPELSHRGPKAFKVIKIFESPMEIFPCSYGEDIRILDVLIASDFEASRARGFVLRSLELHILSFIMGIQYPNLID